MNDRIRIAKTLDECLARGDFADLVFVNGIVHDHEVGVDRAATGLIPHPERIKRMKGIGAKLNTRTDLADLGGLLQHFDLKALASERERGSQATDSATGD